MQYKCSREFVGRRCFAGFARFIPGLHQVNESYLDGLRAAMFARFDNKSLARITLPTQINTRHAPC
jgi:hypothetical protein